MFGWVTWKGLQKTTFPPSYLIQADMQIYKRRESISAIANFEPHSEFGEELNSG